MGKGGGGKRATERGRERQIEGKREGCVPKCFPSELCIFRVLSFDYLGSFYHFVLSLECNFGSLSMPVDASLVWVVYI